MKKLFKKLLEKSFKITTKLTPAKDKLGHSYIGDWIYVISGILIYILFYFIFEDSHIIENAIFALIITFLAACSREWYNLEIEKKKWNWWDVFFTILLPSIITILIIFNHLILYYET